MALANDEKVLEFYLSDNRAVKKDRESCQQVLAKNILGKSILATDDITAKKLGIMSIDELRAQPDMPLTYNCRHSFRRLPQEYLNKIEELLK
jgi:hypothetical protein